MPSLAFGDVIVLVSEESSVQSVNIQELRAIYMGRTNSLPNNAGFVIPLDQGRNSDIREAFFEKIIGMQINQVNSYWTRLTFAGQATPPRELLNDDIVLDVVRKTPGAIGYVSNLPKTSGFRVLMHVKD